MSPDLFWRLAMRDAYANSHHLNAIEMAGLLPLKIQWQHPTQADRWWAAVGVLREDGVTVVGPLTLARLDKEVEDYWHGRLSPNFSMPAQP